MTRGSSMGDVSCDARGDTVHRACIELRTTGALCNSGVIGWNDLWHNFELRNLIIDTTVVPNAASQCFEVFFKRTILSTIKVRAAMQTSLNLFYC